MTPPTVTLSKEASLIRKRGDIKARITRFKTFLIKQENEPDVDEIQIRLESLSENFKLLHNIHDQIVEIHPEGQDHDEELANIEDAYYTVVAKARKLIHKVAQINSSTPSNTSTIHNNHSDGNTAVKTPQIRLPEITIPTFDGTIERWQSFRDKFLARVGNNPAIPIIDKFQYLDDSLVGKARSCIESIETSENNYKEVWEILTNKYDNTRKAILRHWSILHNFPKLQRDTPEALEELIDTFRQHIRALISLGEPVDEWHSCIIYLLLSKINNNTKYQWETTLSGNKMPEYTSLLEFLEKRGSCSEQSSHQTHQTTSRTSNNKHRDIKPQSRVHNTTRGQAFVTTKHKKSEFGNHSSHNNNSDHHNKNFQSVQSGSTSNNRNKIAKVNIYPCPICQDSHSVYKCQTFHSSSIEDKKKLVEKAALCTNCLGKGHLPGNCTSGACRICNEKHHTFLHPPQLPDTTVISNQSI